MHRCRSHGTAATRATWPTFSGESSTSPVDIVSDSMPGMTFDAAHDYYFMVYFDSDGTGYNAALTTWGTEVTLGSCVVGGYASGNVIPSSGGTAPSPNGQGFAVFALLVG